MARLIFCFFAEDTGIFHGDRLFTSTVTQMSERDSSNTHEVISELFHAMNIRVRHEGKLDNRYRQAAGIRNWANMFPYVNGGLFSDSVDVPKFSKIARTYLLHVGNLDLTKINPDIFGSMIQAVADDEERGALGMHYTSVPNILKVLNPLFLDELREKLAEAGDNARKLLNLRQRIARIRVFDPACGSGNFLVIAYKQMREIEAEINRRRGEIERKTDIPLTNYRGIEIRHFSCEIARLALIIAEYQCDVIYRGQQLALAEFLPLEAANWITCGNALRLDWLSICPPTGKGVKNRADDLFETPLDQSEIDFENEGGETYICGNPPYKGAREQTAAQKADLARVLDGRITGGKSLDYVSGWFVKAADYGLQTKSAAAFVSTNSVCQGQSVPTLWPLIFSMGHKITFAHTSFKWSNLARHNAGVTVVVVGIAKEPSPIRSIYSTGEGGEVTLKSVANINAYLIPAADFFVDKRSVPLGQLSAMNYGNYPGDGNYLTLFAEDRRQLVAQQSSLDSIIRPVFGAQEFLKGLTRYCLWIDDPSLDVALQNQEVKRRVDAVRTLRLGSRDTALHKLADRPHQYRDRNTACGPPRPADA